MQLANIWCTKTMNIREHGGNKKSVILPIKLGDILQKVCL